MPSIERENVGHATLLFCAEGVNVRTTGAGEGIRAMNGKCEVALEDNSKVSPRDIYMRLCACRDFEIKLQWERAVFLTAFLIACYAGYGSFLLSVHQHGYGCLSSLLVKCIPVVITFVGVVLSLLWIFMAKGSKAWYEHYEQAIAAFARQYSDDKATGKDKVPEYMMAHRWYVMPDIKRNAMSNGIFNFRGGAYSVSKIVIAIGACSLLIWGVLFLVHCGVVIMGPISKWCINSLEHWVKVAAFLAMIVLAFVFVHYFLTKRISSGYLGIVKLLLQDENSNLKKESWTHQMGSVKVWIEKQTKQATRYVLIEEKRISGYDVCVKGNIKETIVFRRDQCMQFLEDKDLGLYSLERSDALEDEV